MNVKRILSKTNYHIQTDAVKSFIIPKNNYSKDHEWLVYADEADLLNVVLFNCTAKDWRKANPSLVKESKNIRDIASINELVVLSNIETINAQLIKENVNKETRFVKLQEIAEYQLAVLDGNNSIKSLKKLSDNTYIEQSKNK